MKFFSGLFLAIAVSLLGGAPRAAAQAAAPVEAYGRLPAVMGVSISPDGQRLALAVAGDGVTGFQIIDLASGRTERNYETPAAISLRGVSWGDNDHALLSVSGAYGAFVPSAGRRQVEVGATVSFNRHTARQRDLEAQGQVITFAGQPGVGYALGRDDSRRLMVYRVNLENGSARVIAGAVREAVDALIDENGQFVARVDSNTDTNRWDVYAYVGGQARALFGDVSDTGAPMDLAGQLPDGRLVLVGRMSDGVRDEAFVVDPNTGQREVLYSDERYDIGGAIQDRATRRVVGVSWVSDFPHQHFFDAELQAVYERLGAAFGDGYAVITGWSDDRSRFVVRAEHAGDAGAYYVFEPGANSLRSVARLYRDIFGPQSVGDRRAITYAARDGARIPAYLTLPAGAEERNLPLVLFVHGGPHARDTFAFDWWASFMASRGYAVLQPNFRGSTGYGYEWFNIGRGGWGDGVMQTDVEDGVDALVRAGIVDPARVCIVGASYGGYAALAGATITPERYRCAIAVAGVSDPLAMVAETERLAGRRAGIADWWRLSIGDPRADAEHLRAISPVNLAAGVRAPMLLIHGKDDSVVPIQQSRRMVSALRSAGKDVRFVELDGDDHWLSDAETRIQMLREIEAFLAQHLGETAH